MNKDNKLQQNTKITFNIKEIVDDPKGEMKAALDVFASSIVPFLEATSEINIEIINDYNGIIIALLAHENGFKQALENSLMSNQELLTEKQFSLGGKVNDATIENWLKDFIKYHGTDNFSNVVLSKYLSQTQNCQALDENEKKLVRKLLVLYRNLKFFPESLRDVPVERWEIIPVERTASDTVRANRLSIPKTEAEKEIDHLREEEETYDEASLEREAIEEEIDDKSHIEELKAEASKYNEGSLEKMAIEEEINRLEK